VARRRPVRYAQESGRDVGFYQRCGWQVTETVDRSGEEVVVLSYRE
jgi:hypothetical protein